MSPVSVEAERHLDHLVLRWNDHRGRGSCRFDRLEDTVPEWLGSADELLEGAGRRQEGAILDAVGRWATGAGLRLGVWHDDGGIELLT